MLDSNSIRQGLTVACAAVLLVAAGCGGEEADGGSERPAATDGAAPSDRAEGDSAGPGGKAPQPGSTRRDIQATFTSLQDAFLAGDAAGACDQLTKRAYRQTAADLAFAEVRVNGESCKAVAEGLIESYGDDVHHTLDVVELDVRGSRATVTVRSETDNTYTTTVRNGPDGWKVDGSLLRGLNRK